MLQSAKENHITEARKHFVCAIFRTEFTFGKILKPLNIDMQKVIEMHHHNQFVYVINVMDGMIQNIAEIDLAEKEKKVAFSKNEHRKGVLK